MPLSHAHKMRRAAAAEAIVNRCTAIEGVDQVFIAQIARVPVSTVSEWKNGEATMEIWHVLALVEAFGFGILGVAPRLGQVNIERELRGAVRAVASLVDEVGEDLADNGVLDEGEAHARAAEAFLLNLQGLPDALRALSPIRGRRMP